MRIPLALIVVILINFYSDLVIEFFSNNSKIGLGILDEVRTSILEAYLDNLNVWSIITGGSYEGTSIITEFNGNPHNSFIRAHHVFGLFYLVAITLVMIRSLYKQKSIDLKIYSIFIFMILFFRAFTEPILFPTMLDVFYFSMCLITGLSQKCRGH
jgi:hypothetical protein